MGGYHNHSHIRNCNNIDVCIMLGLPYIQGVTYSKYLVGGGGFGGGEEEEYNFALRVWLKS